MKHTHTHRKLCQSWYHRPWFRILLAIVAIDMIILGVSFIFGFDFMSLMSGIHIGLRVIGGGLYLLVASFILHYALSYKYFLKRTALVCAHCVTETSEKN